MKNNRYVIAVSVFFMFALTNCAKKEFSGASSAASSQNMGSKSAPTTPPPPVVEQDQVKMICKSALKGESVSVTVLSGKSGLRAKVIWTALSGDVKKVILADGVNLIQESNGDLLGYNPELTASLSIYSMGLKGYTAPHNAKIAVSIGTNLASAYPKRKLAKSYLYYATCAADED